MRVSNRDTRMVFFAEKGNWKDFCITQILDSHLIIGERSTIFPTMLFQKVPRSPVDLPSFR
jgi:hypothetical protein